MSTFSLPGQGHSEEPEWVVWLTVAISLLLGWVLATSVTGRVINHTNIAGGSLAVPASWVKTQEDGAAFAAADLRQGAFGSRVSVRQVATADLIPNRSDNNLQTAASNWSLLRSQQLEGYRILQIVPTTVKGRDAVLIEYAYLTDPPEGMAGGVMPALMHALDTVVASGDQYSILTVAVDQISEDQLETLNTQIQSGWQLP